MVAVLSLLASALHNQFSGLIVIVFGGAVWIGIRQLDYTEFASASRMFLGGKFRQIIDVETRMADFENLTGESGQRGRLLGSYPLR